MKLETRFREKITNCSICFEKIAYIQVLILAVITVQSMVETISRKNRTTEILNLLNV